MTLGGYTRYEILFPCRVSARISIVAGGGASGAGGTGDIGGRGSGGVVLVG